ncbi:MAG: hypothetical protein ACXWKA_01260 [Xanthobacteraceae bacterium]
MVWRGEGGQHQDGINSRGLKLGCHRFSKYFDPVLNATILLTNIRSITLEDRRAAIMAAMNEQGLRRLVVASTRLHMIDLPNPLMHLTGFRSAGPAFAILDTDGPISALVAPSEDAERAVHDKLAFAFLFLSFMKRCMLSK